MSTSFNQAFPGLDLSDAKALKDIFEKTEISSINYAENRTIVRIYLNADMLIPKYQIHRLEKEIKRQLFKGEPVSIQIIEHFNLSDQYTLPILIEEYKDSIMEDFKESNMAHYTMLMYSDWKLDGEQLIVTVNDNFLAHNAAPQIEQRIRKILSERCGFEASVKLEFKENKNRRKRKDDDVVYMPASLAVDGYAGDNANMPPNAASDMPMDIPVDEYGMPVGFSAGSGSPMDPGFQEGADAPITPLPVQPAPAPAPRSGSLSRNGGKANSKYNSKNKRGFYDKDGKERHYKRTDEEGYIYGSSFEETEFTPIEELTGEASGVIAHGQISALEVRELKNKEKLFIQFSLTDFTDSIMVKIFLSATFKDEFLADFKDGIFIELKGVCMYDAYSKEYTLGSITGIRRGSDFRKKRVDNAPVKRVELHCHTKMSEMDAVSETKDIIKTAKSWGHSSIAITDHGVVHAFTDAFHALDKNDPFKVIYGCEGYLVDDLKHTVTRSQGQRIEGQTFVAFDIETTGFSPSKNQIIEIGAVKLQDGKVVGEFSEFVNPKVPIPFNIEKLTGINDSMVKDAETIDTVLPRFLEFCSGAIMVAHNADFDMSFITTKAADMGVDFTPTYVDTLGMARAELKHLSRFKLDTVAKELNITLEHHHRAVDDAQCCAEIFLKLSERMIKVGIDDLDKMEEHSKVDANTIKKLPTYHIIILATNTVGRFNLYRLVSMAHIDYFSRRPRIPKSKLAEYREGLIIGSACEAGELIRAMVKGESDEEITRIAQFYDYLEIQPIGNNMFMLQKEDSGMHSVEDLQDLNWRVVKLGEQLGKPVCATCDSHFINPEDEVYRRIIMSGKGFDDADNQAPLYLRTTEEMLAEFDYLGAEKAYEVVVENTNLIADMCDYITPVRPDKCPPVIPNSDQILTDLCYKNATAQYGDPLPEIVKARLDRELNSIISNGFAVMYIIAQKLVHKSNEDGYLVGSRGSVGSSFVATMSGITEVNPLSPHYYCKKCKYSEFDSEDVKAYAGGAGCDMPDKVCPVCGEKLIKDGFDIPFETFLGFKGNKEPDIDLNFSGEYQSKAHAYTEVIFGSGQTYRAGTIATLADKTAYGYVKNYYEDHGVQKRTAEINRIINGCVGVRRSTGQHPGGIIVLPLGEEIYTFTPVQHPANDMTTNTITTHFDYHSIDHNLLKLDILGHDDPTMIRMLNDLTGIDPRTFPLDSKEVMSLFQSTEALGITPDQLTNCTIGTLGIPEFGTDFAMQMVIDAKPTCFAHLVRIAGLAHGTDVWLGNAQTLIQEGKATISTAICTRDDIMTYLIQMGMDQEESFTIMESVRKGKGLKPEWEADMVEHGVPDWYIWSCKKIKYMFPKAHAAAYVMSAWRIAYCKIYYPLAYYAAYFSIRATGFSYELMCMGQEKLQRLVKDYWNRRDTLSKKDQDVLKDMRIVQEMFARGYDFMPIDIYRASAQRFQVIDGKIMPSFASIDGMGGKAAEGMELAAKDGPFVSREDVRNRAKISQTLVDYMAELGLLGDMPESNQYSFFDLGLI